VVVDAITQKVGGEILDAKRRQVRRLVVDSSIQTELESRVGGFAVENIEGVAADELHRGSGEANLQRVEVVEQVAVLVVDAAVAFVGDDQVEEAHIEL